MTDHSNHFCLMNFHLQGLHFQFTFCYIKWELRRQKLMPNSRDQPYLGPQPSTPLIFVLSFCLSFFVSFSPTTTIVHFLRLMVQEKCGRHQWPYSTIKVLLEGTHPNPLLIIVRGLKRRRLRPNFGNHPCLGSRPIPQILHGLFFPFPFPSFHPFLSIT